MLDPHKLYAVWDGRFQPFHNGHLAVIREIRNHFDVPVVVMIINSSAAANNNAYTAKVNIHHAPNRNPLTWWERYEMLTRAIQSERLSQVTVLGIPRPDLYWDIAKHFYPTKRFICITDKDEYERSKKDFWEGLGEKVRVLPSVNLPKLSATEVKERIKTNNNWQECMPRAIVDYFTLINGPNRFAEANL